MFRTIPLGFAAIALLAPMVAGAQVTVSKEIDFANPDKVRAAVRLPMNSATRMVFAVADTAGNVLGLYRMRDATVFSIDVAVAKARNTAYYADAAALATIDRVDADAERAHVDQLTVDDRQHAGRPRTDVDDEVRTATGGRDGTRRRDRQVVTIEIEGEDKPACVAESLTRLIYSD